MTYNVLSLDQHLETGYLIPRLYISSYWITASKKYSLNSSHTILCTFGLLPLGIVRTPYTSSNGLNNITTVLLQVWHWHWITHNGWYAFKLRNQTKLISLSTKRNTVKDTPLSLQQRQKTEYFLWLILLIKDLVSYIASMGNQNTFSIP